MNPFKVPTRKHFSTETFYDCNDCNNLYGRNRVHGFRKRIVWDKIIGNY